MTHQTAGIPRARSCVVASVLAAMFVCAAAPVQAVETIGGAIYTDLGNPLTTGLEGVTVTATGTGGTFTATTATAQGLWVITDVPEGTYTVIPCMAGKKFEHIVGGVSDGRGSIEITVDSTPANRQVNQSIQFLASDGVGAPDAGESTVEATSPMDLDAASTITITAKDVCGNPIPGIPAAEVVISATGTPTIVQPTLATDAGGQTTATISWSEPNPSGYEVSATIGGTAVTDTATVVVNTGPASKLAFTGQPAGPYQAGAAINAVPQVTVQDASGNPVDSSVEITIGIGANPGGGTLSGTTTRQASGGVADFPGLSINRTGEGYTLTASAPGLTAAQSSAFNIVAGDPESLSFIGSPDATPALGVLSPAPRVGIYDGLGNLVEDADSPVSVALTPAAANLDGTLTVSAVNGVAEFGDLVVGPPGTFPGTFQLTATSGSLDAATSDSFEVTADPALTIGKVDSADPVDPNDEVTYTITYGNNGLGDATNTVINETLPAELIYVSSTGGGVYTDATKTITWTIGPLSAGTSNEEVAFTARVDPGMMAEGGSITNSQLTIDCDETEAVQAASETTTVNDTEEPVITPVVPVAAEEEVELDTIVKVQITDGTGVDYESDTVTIHVEGDLIYDGANETSPGEYDSTGLAQAVRGVCRRTGTPTAYTFTFVPSTTFGHEKRIDVTVVATDESGNVGQADYYFWTQLRSFGANAKVNSDSGTLVQDNPATAADAQGNIWVVWDQPNAALAGGDRDVYVGRLAVGTNSFAASVAVAASNNNEQEPAVAVDADGVAYVTWQQDDPNGHWDIYLSSSSDGVTWSPPLKLNAGDDKNENDQTAPAIAIDTASALPNPMYVAWESNQDGDQDIVLGTSTDGSSWAETQITDNDSAQTDPVVGVDEDHVAYVLWTDARNAGTTGTDIWVASSDEGPWTPVAVVNVEGDQSSPAGVASNILHLGWVTDLNGFGEIMYANDASGVPVSGTSIIDATEPNAVQRMPALAVSSLYGADTVFACWEDSRNVNLNNDTDIYFAESGSLFGTNILVNDDTGTSRQTKPAIGLDGDGDPYMVWVDGRNGDDDIYYAGATALEPVATTVTDVNGVVTVQSTAQPNLQVEIPAGALPEGIEGSDISISEVSNLPTVPASLGGFGLVYDFGPSGTRFDSPVTIRIPLEDDPGYTVYNVYRYDPGDLTSPQFPWTEEGIHNPATKSPDGAYLEVEVDHFSVYGTGGYVAYGGGGGGGGCALAPWSNAGPTEFMLPFVLFALILAIATTVDLCRRRSGNRAQQ